MKLFAACFLLGSSVAMASIIPTFVSVTGGPTFTYTYDLAIDQFQNVITGNQFCFGGITGLVAGTTQMAGWSAGNEIAGGCPILAGVPPSNAGSSVTWTYTAAPTLSGPLDLGNFTFNSTNGSVGVLNDPYGATGQKKSPLGPTANQGEVNGPIAPNTTPEPATFLLLGSGLVFGGMIRRFRNR